MAHAEEPITEWPEDVHEKKRIEFESLSKFEAIGEGWYGCVYRAQMKDKGLVAVKVLKRKDTRMFVHEANVLDMVSHDNIVKFYGVVNIPKNPSHRIAEAWERPALGIVEEYLEGDTLGAMLTKEMGSSWRTYTFGEALDLLLDVANALRYLHERVPHLVIHRDLSLRNVVITEKEGRRTAKLIDFGLSVLITGEGPKEPLISESLSKEPSPPDAPGSSAGHCRNDDHKPLTSESLSEDPSPPNAPGSSAGHGDNGHAQKTEGRNDDQNHRDPTTRTKRLVPMQGSWRISGDNGLLWYTAPEVLKKEAHNESADVFSFGVIMCELFSRTSLITSEMGLQSETRASIDKYAEKVAKGYRPKVRGDVLKDAKDLVKDCFKDKLEDRPRFAEIVEKLGELKGTKEAQEAPPLCGCKCM